jgi:hypothetical protein
MVLTITPTPMGALTTTVDQEARPTLLPLEDRETNKLSRHDIAREQERTPLLRVLDELRKDII